MKRILLVVAVLFLFASIAEARTMVRVGLFGTKVRAGCGASVNVGPCGVQVAYGGGNACGYGACGYAAPQCYSGGCAPQAHCGSGGCAPQHAYHSHSGAPFGVQCAPNYGTHTQTCTESFVPYPDPAALQGVQLRYRGY